MAKENQLEDFKINENKRGVFYKFKNSKSKSRNNYKNKIIVGEVLSEDGKVYPVYDGCGISNECVVSFEVAKNNETNSECATNLKATFDTHTETGFLIKNEITNKLEFIPVDYKGIRKEEKYIVRNPSVLGEEDFHGMIVNCQCDDSGTCDLIVRTMVNNVTSKEEKAVCYGPYNSIMSFINAIMDKYGATNVLTEGEKKELEKIADFVDLSKINLTDENGEFLNLETYDPSKPNYVDLRDKLFCTIDPKDCQDMDDAVYTEIDKDGNFVTYAAIADVTEYINPINTPLLWKRIEDLGFTAYFGFGARHMLPRKLASGICSLNENEDRLTMCVKTVIDRKTGKRLSGEVFHAVINSKKKFSYDAVQDIFDKNGNLLEESYKSAQKTAVSEGKNYAPRDMIDAIALTKKCSEAIEKERKSRNGLVINSKHESSYSLSDDGKHVDIQEVKYLPSMDVIEKLMVNSNEFVAEYLSKITVVGIYRTHGTPNERQIDRMNAILEHFGYKGNWDGDEEGLRRILDRIKGSENEYIISNNIIMSLARARYSSQPHPSDPKTGDVLYDLKCHSALDSKYYTHFTSGIRRMADLIVQYTLKRYIRAKEIPFDDSYYSRMAAKLSAREKEVDDAMKECRDLFGAFYANDEKNVNTVVTGRVVDIDSERGYVVVLTSKNVRLNVPYEEFADLSKNKPTEFGISIIKDGVPVVSLGDKLTCKISGGDTTLREAYASTRLDKTFKPRANVEDPYAIYRVLYSAVSNVSDKIIEYNKTFLEVQKEIAKREQRLFKNNKGRRK